MDVNRDTAGAQTIDILDLKLRSALELALGKEVGANITQMDMASLQTLDAFQSGIQDSNRFRIRY